MRYVYLSEVYLNCYSFVLVSIITVSQCFKRSSTFFRILQGLVSWFIKLQKLLRNLIFSFEMNFHFIINKFYCFSFSFCPIFSSENEVHISKCHDNEDMASNTTYEYGHEEGKYIRIRVRSNFYLAAELHV